MEKHLIIVGIGIVAGLFAGLLGIGGAILIIPALVMFLGFSQQTAQGTTLLMLVLPVGALAAWQYYKAGKADFQTAMILAATFFIGGFFGGKFANQVPEIILRKAFAVLMLLIAGKILLIDK